MLDLTVTMVLVGSVRIATALLLIPQLLGSGVPSMVKVMLVLALAILMGKAGVLVDAPVSLRSEPGQLIGCMFDEVVIGLVIGMGAMLSYAVFFMAGKLLDTQMGLAMAQIYDPAGGRNGTIFAGLFSQLSLLMLFLLQFHHHVLRQLAYSFEQLPLCSGGGDSLLQRMDFGHVGELLGLGVFMVAPFILCLFAIDLVVAVIAQAAPQFNALLLSMGIKIGVGILMLALSGPQLQQMAHVIYQAAMNRWDSMLEPPPIDRSERLHRPIITRGAHE